MVTAYVALAYYFRWSMIEDLWPWKGYDDRLSPLSFYFLSSIAAATSAPLLWLAITNKMRASVGGAINLVITFTQTSVYMLLGYRRDPDNLNLLVGAAVLGASAVVTAFVGWRTRTIDFQDRTPTPRTVLVSFGVFIVALILVGGALVLKVPRILPWDTTEEASVVYGWIFLGAACYFAYGLRYPVWDNAIGQLLGFLAYDLVLILPFIRQFSVIAPDLWINLVLYTIVVVYSGALAVYYCFINPRTRINDQIKDALRSKVQGVA